MIAVVACGTDQRAAFDAPALDASPPSASLGDGGSFPNTSLCDEGKLLAARSPAGCRFLATEISWSGNDFPNYEPGGCHPLLVTNSSTEAAHLRLRFEDREEDAAPYATTATVKDLGASYAPLRDGVLHPGETAVVSTILTPYRSDDPTRGVSECPTKAFVESSAPSARYQTVTPAIELLSDVPILAVYVYRYQLSARLNNGATDGAMTKAYPLFPVHLFATSVMETGIFKPGLPSKITTVDQDGSFPLPVAPVRRVVVSAFDDTQVTLAAPDGSTRTVVLQRGDAWADDSNDAFVGRSVTANRPVGVISGCPSAFIPWDFPNNPEVDEARALSASLPEALWGSEYVAVRHGDRWPGKPEQPPWRIIGGADGTKLTYEPAKPDGAPDTIDRGQLAVFFADAPFVVRSQDAAHPFYVGGHMTGANYQKQRYGFVGYDEDVRGGPVSLHVLATSRWVKRYDFFALPTYPNANLVVIRKRGAAEVRLDCAGTLAGWQPIGASYEFVRVALTGPLYESVGTCQVGAHQIVSDDPFAATLWGWGDYETVTALGLASSESYGLPLFGVDTETQSSTH